MTRDSTPCQRREAGQHLRQLAILNLTNLYSLPLQKPLSMLNRCNNKSPEFYLFDK